MAGFKNDPAAFSPIECYVAVKDFDQVNRLERLRQSGADATIGRRWNRSVEKGLLARAVLVPGAPVEVKASRELDEVRGVVQLDDGELLVSSDGFVLRLDQHFDMVRSYHSKNFGLIHNIALKDDGNTLLVAATGTASIVELSLLSGGTTWEWVTWEHGWNPDMDGVLRTRSIEQYWDAIYAGRQARFVQIGHPRCPLPLVGARTTCPNSVCYRGDKVLATLIRCGTVVEIDRTTGQWTTVIQGLSDMPHGILPCGDGWLVSDTRSGAVFTFDKAFVPQQCITLINLPKHPGLGAAEWIQHTFPLGDDRFIVCDAHRGIILLDLRKRAYAICAPDPTWSVHLVEPICSVQAV